MGWLEKWFGLIRKIWIFLSLLLIERNFCGIDLWIRNTPEKFFIFFPVIFLYYQIFFVSHYSFLKITNAFIPIMIQCCHSLLLSTKITFTHLKQILASRRSWIVLKCISVGWFQYECNISLNLFYATGLFLYLLKAS